MGIPYLVFLLTRSIVQHKFMKQSATLFFVTISLLVMLCACPTPKNNKNMLDKKYTNELIHETSPYLLQHAHNPVNWRAWNNTSLDKAKKENKLMIISIGYAACHWCHVMEHESFEDTAVAHVMNQHFINIKVDREERPDVDLIYMEACQAMTGNGGWPLNIIALPDGKPIYAATYLPKDKWIYILEKLEDSFQNNRKELVQYADSVTKYIKQPKIKSDSNYTQIDSIDTFIDTFILHWMPSMDRKYGASIGGNKFPMPNNYDFLFYYNHLFNDNKMYDYAKLSIDKMCNGGIYDQLGGGFSRYSVDDHWLVPHFEKMLYDNAQLISLYATAYVISGNKRYAEIVKQTIQFIEEELMSKEKGFYSSLDADSDGEEGKYYYWKYDELENLLGNNSSLVNEFYGITPPGNWEDGKNVLHREQSIQKFASSNGISTDEFTSILHESEALMLAERKLRNKPTLDDKIIVAWNALMIKAYVDAFKVTKNPNYLTNAKANASFLMMKCMTKDYRINRNYKNGKSNINAYLDDYAFCIDAFIALYENTFETRYINMAKGMTDYCINHFYDENESLFYYTSNLDKALIARKFELDDNVIPSSNSMMAINLLKISKLYGQQKYYEKADKMISVMKQRIVNFPKFHSNWCKAVLMNEKDYYEIAIVGPNALSMKYELDKYYIPNALFIGSSNGESKLPILIHKYKKDQTLIYICKNNHCQLPVKSVKEALQQIGYTNNEHVRFKE